MAFNSCLVSSWEEIETAMARGLAGSVLVIPFGATEGTECAIFKGIEQMGEKHFTRLLAHARYRPLLHIVEGPPGFTVKEPPYFMVQT